jgi:hypothetical protein
MPGIVKPIVIATSVEKFWRSVNTRAASVSTVGMAIKLRPARLTVLIGLAAVVVCGVAVFCTHRGSHGRTAEERAAYEIGEKAGEQTPRDAKLPTDDELNMMAQKRFEQQGSGDQLQNPPPPGGLEARKQAFEQGYRDGFKKVHPEK